METLKTLEYYDFVRVANLLMGIAVFTLTALKGHILWPHLPLPGRLMYFAWGGLVAASTYGTTEALILDVEPGFRVSFLGGSLIVALIAFLTPDEQTGWMMKFKRQKK